MEPIRILHMIGSLNVGGSQKMVIDLYNHIDRSKVQFDFIIDQPNETFFANLLQSMGARIYTMPTFNGANLISVKRSWKKFFIEHPEYKIIHSHVRSYASVYLPIARKYGLITIIHSHSTSNGRGVKAAIKKILQYPLRYQADYFFSCSVKAGEWLFGKKIVNKENHKILKNAIDVKKYRYNEEMRFKKRKELKVDDCFVVGTVGRIVEQKNPMFIVDICKSLKESTIKTGYKIKFLWVGDGELSNSVNERLNRYGLADMVIMTGIRTDVNEILQAMDVFVFPSIFEGLGIVAVEAQAAGLPTLCSIAVPEEAKVSELCEFLPCDNTHVWVERILENRNVKRTDTQLQVSKAGYDINDSAKSLQEFYESVSGKIV